MNEAPFVRDIRASLDRGLDQIDPATRSTLYEARRRAVDHAVSNDHRGGALTLARHHPWRVALLLAGAAVLAAWWAGRPAPPSEDAEVDILLLTGNIPPQAYADWRLVSREDVGAQCVLVR